jgi:glucosylglycerol-phosphate synthase
LPLTPDQVSSFYHITSKEAFWPILHSFKERYNYDPVDWPTFREVNWAFAEAAAAEAAPGAAVWVHDYNLWLVPGYLRTLRPDVKISFFHHTPFPAADMFNVLPWRREIVESLLACDVRILKSEFCPALPAPVATLKPDGDNDDQTLHGAIEVV